MRHCIAIPLALVSACRREAGPDKRDRAAPVEIIDRSTASGATALEAEPNNTRDLATPLPIGTATRAAIGGGQLSAVGKSSGGHGSAADPGRSPPNDDVIDWFRIDVDKPGILAVLVTSNTSAELAVDLTDSRGTAIAKSQRRGAWTKHGIPNVGVTPGRYFAVVRAPAANNKKAAGNHAGEPSANVATHYEITAQWVIPELQDEVEPNADRTAANPLSVEVPATGFVGWGGDVDVWRLSIETLSSRNAIDIDISAVDGVALEIDIANGLGESILLRKSPRGSKLVVRDLVPMVPPNSPAHYDVSIRGTGSNPETPYHVRVTVHLVGVDAELEPNDTSASAQRFPADRSIIHATWSAGDVDCFALPPQPGGQSGRVVVSPTGEFDPVIELVVDGNAAATANLGGAGVPEQLAVTPGSVVCVKSADRSSAGAGRYDVTIYLRTP